MHVTSDLFIWLAYVSIPLVLFYFTRRRDLPFPRLFILFALFILACGTTHLVEALIFEYPIYRFAGVLKGATAVVSWVTVIALVPVIPRVMREVAKASPAGNDTKPHQPLPAGRHRGRVRTRDYIIAILAGALAVLIRAAVDPLMKDDHIFVVALLAVVYVSWQYGFQPAIVCLLVSMLGYVYFFVPPRGTIFIEGLGNQFAVALFFFCGVACAALGESQLVARHRARVALATAVARREELESEIVRRRVVEAALRQRETDLVAAQRETAEALARLNAFLDNAPLGIAFFDPDLRFVRINPHLAAANGKPVEEHTGRLLSQVLPEFPPDLLARYRHTAGPDGTPFTAQVRGADARRTGVERTWQVTVFPVRTAGRNLGAGVVAQDITDRLRAEDELRRSERNLSDFFENANVGLHWTGPDGTVVRANKAELELLGYTREEYVGHRIDEFHDDPGAIRDLLARLKQGERLDNVPARLRCKDGTRRDVLVSSSGLWEDGRLVHSRCFTRDVTDLKRTTDALRESEERFRSMADGAPALIWLSDLDGRRTFFNNTWLEFAGRTLEQELGYGWSDNIHPEDRDRYLSAYEAAFAERRPFELEYRFRRWDGQYRWVLARGTPRFVSGSFDGFIGLCLDVTERREAVEAVRQSEERYRMLTEAVPHIVWNADARGEMTYFNRRWFDYTALPLEGTRGGGWAAAVHPDDRTRVYAAWQETIAAVAPGGGDRFNHEFRLRDGRTGGYRWFLSVAVPLCHPDGRVDRWIGSMADIHDQKSAAEAIRQSEAFRRSVFENSPDCLMILDTDGRVLEINAAGCRLLDLDGPEAVRGALWADQWPAANRETIREAVTAAGDGRSARFQGFCSTAAGTPKYWDVSVAPLPGADGRAYRLIGVARDVTEERRAEERVRESEELFRQLAESIPQLAWMTDPEGNIFWYNQRWYDYTGTTFDQMKGGWQAVHDPAELPRVQTKFRAHIASGEPWEDTFPLRGRDGKYRWHLSRARPMKDATGAVIRWFGTNTDISAQRELEQSLRASESRFRTLTEAVPQMVWTADPEGQMMFVNRRWEEFTGVPAGSGRRSGWGADLLHPDDAEGLVAAWQAAVAHEAERFAHEFRLRRAADGEYRWLLAVAVPLCGAAGAVSEWVGTLTDIDDQKRHTELLARLVRERTAELEDANAALREQIEVRKAAEERLRAVAVELERSNGELEKFAYIASHDLQEPLRKIQAFGDRLRIKCRDQLPDTGKEFVDRMLSAAGRMRRLIDDLLTFSRVTTQQRPFVRVDLDKLVREVVSDLEERIGQEGGRVVVGELGTIEADQSQMRQLFQNLIVNAVKFHRPGVPPVVEIAGEPEPAPPGAGDPVPAYRVAVRDNGIGFEDKYRERIFDVFQRLHGRNEYEGTGVGLAICRKIAERHGGTITARGRPGEGATFVVALPVRRIPTREATVHDDYPEQTDHDPDGGR